MPPLYCPECSYNLTGLTEHRCPECGSAFDPDELVRKRAECTPVNALVLWLFLAPIGFAAASGGLVAALGALFPRVTGELLLAFFLMLTLATMLHALELAFRLDANKQAFLGRREVPWYIDMVWPTWLLYWALEFVLAMMALGILMMILAVIFQW
jgi:hypothetical protein